jgi:hypothetical protein
MVKGKATATVSGRIIAETDEYEEVEGNVYVRFESLFEIVDRADAIVQFPPSYEFVPFQSMGGD